MANRNTDKDLRDLFPQDNSNKAVQHYIDDANILVTETLATAGFSADRLKLIEKYLAAHLYVLAEHEGGIFEEKIGDTEEKRGSTFTLGQGLRLTRWGQQVLALDTSGGFARMEGTVKKTAQFRLV